MAVTRAAGKATRATATTATAKPSTVSSKKLKSKAASDFPERTADGRYIIVNNRRWRATDPLIPADELEELKHFLAVGRSGTRVAKGRGKAESDDAVALSRKRTGLAKLGLGERGQPAWWEDSDEGRRKRWEDSLDQLRKLEDRQNG